MAAYNGNEKRAYVRDEHYDSHAQVSKDGKSWTEVKIADLSASGMKFYHPGGIFAPGEVIKFRFGVKSLTTVVETKLLVGGKIMRASSGNGSDGFEYGVAFVDIKPEARITIDEIIQHKTRQYGDMED